MDDFSHFSAVINLTNLFQNICFLNDDFFLLITYR